VVIKIKADTMDWREWMAALKHYWAEALPRCEDRGCNRVRGVWRRLCWRRGGTRLHGAWYCSPQCFEGALQKRFVRASMSVVPPQPIRHRIPLGLLMLSRGQVTNRQLRSALETQRIKGDGRIGHWLEELGFATEHQVTAALGLQWACPVLPALRAQDTDCSQMLPFRLLERFRMLPVRFVAQTNLLFMAFCEGVDYTALYAIEQIMGCRTEPCLISPSLMDLALEQLAHAPRSRDLLFESSREAAEMARIACGYALKLGADDVRIAGCGVYIWARLQRNDKEEVTNLLFQRPVPALEGPRLSFKNQSLRQIASG
jgi:hypothetical protein